MGTLACGLAPNYELLMLARIFTGLFGGVLGAVILSIVGDVIPFEKRGRAMAIVMAAFSAASVFGVPFGLWIATAYGWNAPFLFLAVLALPIHLFIHKLLPPLKSHLQNADAQQTKIIQTLTNITANVNQRKAITLMIVVMFGHFCIIPFLSPYMVSNVGFTEHQLSYIYLFGGLCTILSSRLTTNIIDSIFCIVVSSFRRNKLEANVPLSICIQLEIVSPFVNELDILGIGFFINEINLTITFSSTVLVMIILCF